MRLGDGECLGTEVRHEDSCVCIGGLAGGGRGAVPGEEIVNLCVKARGGYRLELQMPRVMPREDTIELTLSLARADKETFDADPVEVVVLGQSMRCLRLRARSHDLQVVLAPGVGVVSIKGDVECPHAAAHINMRRVSVRRPGAGGE